MSLIHQASPMSAIAGNSRVEHCPRCNSETMRVWQRPVYRFFSRLRPIRRYRCLSFQCQWEGNLRAPRDSTPGKRHPAQQARGAPGPVSRVFVLSVALALAATVFLLISSYTGWLEPGGFLVSTATVPITPSPST